MSDRYTYRLNLAALVLALGHHADHALRGDHLGWPLTAEINVFTATLGIYPLVLTSLALYRAGRFGPGHLAIVTGLGLVLLTAVHLGPDPIEPPADIINGYEPGALGWLAFLWLIGLLVTVALTLAYEVMVWRSAPERPDASTRSVPKES